MPAGPAGRQGMQVSSNHKVINSTLPFTQITGRNTANGGVWKLPRAFNLLKRSGAGDGTRTREFQLGKLTFSGI